MKYESYLSLALQATPIILDRGQNNLHRVGQRYQSLQLQVTKLKQLIVLLNWSYRIGKRWKII